MTREAGAVTIGLEVHVQLGTRTKLFCGCANRFGAPPNTLVCPVCLGLPGALPLPNAAAVELAVRAALALGCEPRETSVFARKNYFYPDLPKGYQITQHDRPVAGPGALPLPGGGAVRIRRLHLEEDAGKSLHDRFADASAIDLNRAGVPLIEIVTEPELESPAAARGFLIALKRTLEYVEVSDCDMEKGSLRVDANVSLRRIDGALGTRVEIKNMNSFAAVEKALAAEAARQAEVLAAGGSIAQETRSWDSAAGVVRPLRGKEESPDYRYFADPDLPPLMLAPGSVEAARLSLPELPLQRAARLRRMLGISDYEADVLTSSRALADYFEAAAAGSGDAGLAARWVLGELLARCNRDGVPIEAAPVPASELGALLRLLRHGDITRAGALAAFARMADTRESAGEAVEAAGVRPIEDAGEIAAWARAVIDASPAEAARVRAGEEKLFGVLMGRLMKRAAGRVDAKTAAAALRAELQR